MWNKSKRVLGNATHVLTQPTPLTWLIDWQKKAKNISIVEAARIVPKKKPDLLETSFLSSNANIPNNTEKSWTDSPVWSDKDSLLQT